MNPQEATRDVRVLWFTRGALDSQEIRLAVASSGSSCDLHVLEQTRKGIWKACVAIRTGPPLPALILVECLPGGGVAHELESIRSRPQLRSLPLAILGDARDADAAARAAFDGADGFLRLPDPRSDVAELGQRIARFWAAHRTAGSSEGRGSVARGA